MKTKVILKLEISLNRGAQKRELKQLTEWVGYLLESTGFRIHGINDIEISVDNNSIPLKVEKYSITK